MLFQKVVFFTGSDVSTVHKNKVSRKVLTQQNSLTSNTNIFWTLNDSVITNTILKMNEKRNFRCINSLRFFADISKKLQKRHNFWQFKDHKSGKTYETKTNYHIFFTCFLNPKCLGAFFFHLKIVKIHFHGVTLWFILVCRWRLWDYEFVLCDSGNIHIEENDNQVLLFLSSWE